MYFLSRVQTSLFGSWVGNEVASCQTFSDLPFSPGLSFTVDSMESMCYSGKETCQGIRGASKHTVVIQSMNQSVLWHRDMLSSYLHPSCGCSQSLIER